MKAILLNKLSVLRERVPALPPIPLSPIAIKRAALGAAFGLVFAFIVSLFLPDASQHGDNAAFTMDSEIVTLDKPEQSDDTDEIRPSGQFGFFTQNQIPLTPDQASAIAKNAPRLSIILNNVGQREEHLQRIVETFPPQVTLSLSPYTTDFNTLSKSLHDNGYEVWLSLRTQTKALNTDTGPDALSPVRDLEANIGLLDNQIKRKTNVAGIVIPPLSLVVESDVLWRDLTYEMFAIGYGILDTTHITIEPALFYHKDASAPYIKNDFLIDASLSKDKIIEILKTVRTQIDKDKNAIVTVTSLPPASLDILVEWINAVKAEGITLIPLSAQTQLKK